MNDLLLIVSELKGTGGAFYTAWTDVIGSFMTVMGAEKFFQTIPLRLMDFDLNSLSYAQDSRSYLLPIMKTNLTKGDLAFYLQYFVPEINNLEQMRLVTSRPGS